jgi:DNA repair protein SbcC/Rad50
LFAITGPTGAGKTTVLDAITVGLYGMAHRHKRTTVSELMTRHTGECFSEVEFEANGKSYRSKWSLHRSRKKATGELQSPSMELADVATGEIIEAGKSQVPPKVAELCGLDYDQFLRSVMLSQGDFARFLKADPKDRSSLLEKITDTGIYTEISRFAFEKARTERHKKDELERRLQDSKLLPEGQRQGYEATIVGLNENEVLLNQQTNALQEKRQWLQQLTQLRQRAAHYQANLAEQEEKLASLQPEFRKLQQHEQAHQFVGELSQINAANGHLTEVQQQLASIEKQLPVLEAELEQAGNIALETNKTYQLQEQAVQELEPLLTKVLSLDHQLQTAKDQFNKNKATCATLEAQLQQDKQSLQEKKLEQEKLKQNGTNLKSWLEQHVRLQDLKEHLPEFKATLRDLQEVELRIRRNQQEQDELRQQHELEARQVAALTQEQAQQQQQQEALQQQHTEKLIQLKGILADKSMEALEEASQSQPALAARYERMLELAQQHAAHLQKLQRIEQAQVQQDAQQKETTSKLNETQAAHKQAEEHLEALQKLVQLQQQIQQYEAARHTLHEGDPCPLCGSCEHPFAQDGYTFDLPEEVQKRDKQQQLVRELGQQVSRLELELGTLLQKQQLASTANSECEAEVARNLQLYTDIASGLPQTIAIIETDALQQLVLSQQASTRVLLQQLTQARALAREIEGIKQLQQSLREKQVQAQARLSQSEQSDKLFQTQLQKLRLALIDEQEQLQANTETAASFAAAYEQVYKPEARQELLQTLEQQATTYTRQARALEEMREAFATMREQVKNLNERVSEKESELQTQLQVLHVEDAQIASLQQERVKLFGEKDPQKERQAAHYELRSRAQQAEAARSALQKKQLELQEQQQRKQECTVSQTHQKSKLDAMRDGLLRVLRQKGIETIEALSQMLLHRDEADRLANLKAHTEKQRTEISQSLRDVLQELAQTETKALTTETQEALQLQLTAKSEELRELIASRAKLEQLLDQDRQQREKNQELAQQLQVQQQESNRWGQLSDLIGSHDGNKFSRFAQGLTLARLVELANRHLHKLNDRYRILKSADDDLELLIVDTYQAEAVRPMNTLSGGESFLVSLALALGLSDLAGRRTQINSLFIDEGFGTLDAETLDAAISTLENLQASGKMIGIISHVEALKERISTQILVTKRAGGVSSVSVIS